MEVSEKRLAANRANAQKSTGPKDTSKTKFNGIKHGLTATHALLPWEHAEDLQAVIDSFEARFAPIDNFERLLVKQAAEAYWRMERSLRVEASILETLALAQIQASGMKRSDLHAGHLEAVSLMHGQECIDRYRRYDAHLQRCFERALARVEKMASLRTTTKAKPLPPPEPVEHIRNTTLKECVPDMNQVLRHPVQMIGDCLT